MIKDKDGNNISICEKPNGHLLILGGSGYGKTYFICRRIEEKIKTGKRILVFDYSGIFTESEMQKNQIFQEKVNMLNPNDKAVSWIFCGNNLANILVDAMLKAGNISSYFQRKILQKSIETLLQRRGEFSFSGLLNELENIFYHDEERDMHENAGRLLTRLGPISISDEIRIKEGKDSSHEAMITAIQLSGYPEMTRKFLTEFLSEITWAEVRSGNKRADIVVFDGFQNLSMKQQGSFASILREGRKFGLSAYFSSQFVTGLDKEKIDTLMQAGSIFFFHPTIKDLRSTAELIDFEHMGEWKKILANLQIGEAVLKGAYRVNEGKKLCERPIICRIQADDPILCEIDKDECTGNKGVRDHKDYNSQKKSFEEIMREQFELYQDETHQWISS